MSEWISVEDELPLGQQVIARYMKPFFGVPTACFEMAFFEEPQGDDPDELCGWLFWRDNKRICYPVTHWMQLPEHPKDGE